MPMKAFFTAVLTLCACTPPLDQVLMLWDFLLAFGVHLNVLCVIAQLLLIREEVMSSPRFDFRLLRTPPRSCHPSQPHAPLTNFSSARSCSSYWDSGHACTRSACRTLRRTRSTSIRNSRSLRLTAPLYLSPPSVFIKLVAGVQQALCVPKSCSILILNSMLYVVFIPFYVVYLPDLNSASFHHHALFNLAQPALPRHPSRHASPTIVL